MGGDRWLSADELARLTKRVRPSAQCRELARLGVPFEVNAAGEPLVDAARYFAAPKSKPKQEPNWGALRRGQKAA